MSRVGKMPIKLPDGVEAKVENSVVRVKGPKGDLSEKIPNGIEVDLEDQAVVVSRASDSKKDRALHGLVRSLIANMVMGVSQGFERQLEVVGVGYRAAKKGEGLELQVGYSKPVGIPKIEGVEFEVPAANKVVVKGTSKQLVGEVAARIRSIRPPEPYKGKGIRYLGEHVKRKAGKTAK